MLPGGVGVMLLRTALAAAVCAVAALLAQRRWGRVTAWSLAGFCWAVAVILIVTLTPAYAVGPVVPAESRSATCSLDYGGPSPDGFWIFSGGQRMLNVALFVPAGALLVLGLARWRAAWVFAPLGLVGLVGLSVAIELVQLELARIDRACDITDVVDNATGAGLGFAIGLALALILQPWRARRRSSSSLG